MNMLLAEIGPAQWVLLGVIVLLIICYPIFIVFKNKKEQQKAQQMTDSLKVGKDVLTSSGVYGTIVAIEEKENCKIVTLQTGTEENKGYISVDSLAIYMVLNPDPVEEVKEEKQPENEEKVETKQEVVVEENKENGEKEQEVKENNEVVVESEKTEVKAEKKAKKNKKTKN